MLRRQSSHELGSQRVLVLLDRETGQARLQLCSCPRCDGYLTVVRRVATADGAGGSGPGEGEEGYWDEDDEEAEEEDELWDYAVAPSLSRGFSEEEEYERRHNKPGSSRQGRKGASKPRRVGGVGGVGGGGAGLGGNKPRSKQKPVKASVWARKQKREEMAAELIEARKSNKLKRITNGTILRPCSRPVFGFGSGGGRTGPGYGAGGGWQQAPADWIGGGGGTGADLLSAEELGMEGDAYRMLLDIANGREITPEDFDLLLQLDKNNEKQVLNVTEVERFDVITVAQLKADRNSDGAMKGPGMCMICLSEFEDQRDEHELRRLPCDHLYCKECIDQWQVTNLTSTQCLYSILCIPPLLVPRPK